MKRPVGIYFIGFSLIGLSFLACANTAISVFYYSRVRPDSLSGLTAVTDAAYGLLLAGFVQLFGWLIFPLFLIGGGAVVPIFIGFSGYSLMNGKDWARKFLTLFSAANFVFWVLEIPSMNRELFYRLAVAVAALLFHGVVAVYLSLLRKPTLER